MKVRFKDKRYWWLIEQINQNNYHCGAEIGCAKGMTTFRLLKFCPQLSPLYAVDLWDHAPVGGDIYLNWNFPLVYSQFRHLTRNYRSRMIVLRGISWEMADKVEDGSLDFIFIDADHVYESVKKDILAWIPKVREGGLVSGHDWDFPGVRQAIDELLPEWKDAYMDHVWWLKKGRK